MSSCWLRLNKLGHTRREISSAPGKLLQCSSCFFSYSSPAFLVPKQCDSFSYQTCTCQINSFTSNLSHSFQRCCSAFFFVISRLSSSTEEPLSCPSSPYEREQKACVYLTDGCHAQTEGLGLNLLQCATVLGLQSYIVSLLVLKLTLAARVGKHHANIKS